MNGAWKWAIAAVLWWLASVYGLILRETNGSETVPFTYFDKFCHALLFLAQTWLLAKYWLAQQRRPPYGALLAFGALWGALSEAGQWAFTRTRQADIWDFVADIVGVLMALQLAHWRAQAGKMKG